MATTASPATLTADQVLAQHGPSGAASTSRAPSSVS